MPVLEKVNHITLIISSVGFRLIVEYESGCQFRVSFSPLSILIIKAKSSQRSLCYDNRKI